MLGAAPLALAGPALAQDPHAHHHPPAAAPVAADPHAGHHMPAAPADPHAGRHKPAAPADPHAGHHMPAAPADPHAGHDMPAAPADPQAGHQMPAAPADPHAGHHMPAAPADPHAGHAAPASPVGAEPAPPPPADHAAERYFPAADMARARTLLRHEHGAVRWSKVMAETFELRPSADGDQFAWEGAASHGDDIHRLLLKTEGELDGGDLHEAEVQGLYARAIGPYFNLNAGVRQDIEPRPRRTYLTVGLDGLAPYWFELEGALFLSNKGDVSARLEGSYDLRLTQALILEPRAEANLAASADRAIGEGAGLRDIELGLRLRYEIRQTFAPYVGVHWRRKFGDTADDARAEGEAVEDTRAVVGVRAFF
jgi:copper resistance protein B